MLGLLSQAARSGLSIDSISTLYISFCPNSGIPFYNLETFYLHHVIRFKYNIQRRFRLLGYSVFGITRNEDLYVPRPILFWGSSFECQDTHYHLAPLKPYPCHNKSGTLFSRMALRRLS